MKRSILLVLPLLLAALLFSCNKNNDGEHNTVTPGSFRSLDEAINSTAPVSKSTSIIVSTGGRFIAPGGTIIIFPPNSFETLNGVQVTGSVQVTFLDWLKKGDMIFGRVLPLTDGVVEPYDVRPLLSGGEAFIQVSQNGQVVRMRKGIHATVMFPQFGAPALAMTGWVGRTMAGSANTVNWLSVDMVVLNPENILTDTISMRTDTLHYIQAAVPLDFTSAYNNFKVRLNSPVTLENTMAVVLYDNKKSVFPLTAALNGEINAQRVPSLPMHIAVMGIYQGNFYGGIAAVPIPKDDSIYSVIIKAIEPPTFKLQLNQL